ncbi:NHLP bacteriocin export ABC transporter permease/ATPase subunit [Massilia sp. TS11]|uniref:NHLP bacteriocin export ABC transporter permease/ATPase subunit n=1 Tax=Massilia sp. TS11 TaxID=2908003 RepID=UPI001EDB7E34|nr:NHLP bacteriocin export ABC transporter permease/ATPase subunit [Massilia sp. TS11]MCG2586360.1 NHLP bacteriocin export ABC transporter permease/ATPase subunit [Massilia sp. TS11]
MNAVPLPRQARTLEHGALLEAGAFSLFLHDPRPGGRGLIGLGQVDGPAVLPPMQDVLCGRQRYRVVGFPAAGARLAPLPAAVTELEPWLNGASAVAACWPPPAAGLPVDCAITRGLFAAHEGQRIASPALVLARVQTGFLLVDGLDGEELHPGALVALPREIALTAAEEVVLDVFRFGEAAQDVRMASLQRLWDLSFKMAWERGFAEGADEEARISDARLRDANDLNAGMAALAGLVEGDRSWLDAGKKDPGPLLTVMQHVGRVLGMPFTRDVRRGRTNADTANDLAEANGVRCRQVLLTGRWWEADNGPLLAFDAESDLPIALVPEGGQRNYLLHAHEGKAVPVNAETARRVKPYAFVFYRPLPNKALNEFDLLRFGLHGQTREMAAVIALAGVIGLLGLVVPLASARVMDVVIPGAQQMPLVQMGLALLCVSLTSAVFSLVRSLMVLRIQDKMDMAIQAAVWDRLLRMPAAFHRKYTVANLEARVRACQRVIRILSARTVASIFAGAFSALNFVVLFWFSASLSLMALAMVVLAAGAVTWFRRRTRHIAANAPDSPRKLSALVLHMIQGVGKLRVAAAEGRAFAQWSREHAIGEVPNTGMARLRVVENVFFRAYDHLAVLVLFGLAGYLVASQGPGHLSAGEFVGFFAAFGGVFKGVLGLCETLVEIVAVGGAYNQARPILETLPEAEAGKTDPGALGGQVEVNRVSFAYPGGPPVLHEVSLLAKPGDFVAIVGGSGSGKSTLLRLLLGFEKPGAGSILFDNKDLAELHLRKLRRQFGVVLQDTRLLAGDLFANIVGDSGATLDEAWAAAEAAAVDADIRAMPMGMFTVIGDGASTLSAGQRQRILIARALVRKPPVLFLDEATSLLDGPAQARVMANLARLRITRIVIAHRLASLVDADQIIVLENGRVAEHGSYRELMAADGLFRRMADEQSLSAQH